MAFKINTNYPSIEHLRKKAKKRMPRFAYDYLTEGCNDDLNVTKNTQEIREIELMPYYLTDHEVSNTKVELFGVEYDAPIGIPPIGLQSLMWPGTAEYLAKASVKHNIPFILSTVTTLSIEKAAEYTNSKFWYQLYYPADNKITDDILQRLKDTGCKTLVLLSDVPTFGYRPKDIFNGFGMPPQRKLRNIVDAALHPAWSLATLKQGIPTFNTLEKYMPKGMDLQQLGIFMDKTFSGRLTIDKIKYIQDRWDGRIVIKGLANCEDMQKAVDLGIDGVILSNHGGRQLDAGPTVIKTLPIIAENFKDKIKIMFDSGTRNGPDIARVIASGADFVFTGRPFMFGCAALGEAGADQVAQILKREFQQVMEQVCCKEVKDLPNHLIKNGIITK